jgi:hypothetical protein
MAKTIICIRLSSEKDMYAFPAEAEIVDGAIVLRTKDGQTTVAAGQWEYCYAASSVDGSPEAVEHWIQDKRGVPGRRPEVRRMDGVIANSKPGARPDASGMETSEGLVQLRAARWA